MPITQETKKREFLITDSADIAIPLSASGGNTTYAAVGAAFEAVIPANGLICFNSIACRILNDATATTHGIAVGIRIGTTNYWFSQFNNNGTLSSAASLSSFSSGTTASGYMEYNGATTGGLYFGIDIAASAIPSGKQTIQLIMCCSQLTVTLKGTIKQTRVILEIKG